MSTDPASQTYFDRRIGLRLTPRSLAPGVVPALEALGYSLHDVDDDPDLDNDRPAVWLVDDSRQAELPTIEEEPDMRLLVVGPPKLTQSNDDRVVVRIPRPARLTTIYSKLQSTLELSPRRTPRVRTQLPARCIRSDRHAVGALLSLSEGGCLLRTTDRLRKGSRVRLQFALPEYGLLNTRAECCYTRRGDAGMEFADPTANVRHSIAQFVTLQLAEHDRNQGQSSSVTHGS
jgi:hypothetical protein